MINREDFERASNEYFRKSFAMIKNEINHVEDPSLKDKLAWEIDRFQGMLKDKFS